MSALATDDWKLSSSQSKNGSILSARSGKSARAAPNRSASIVNTSSPSGVFGNEPAAHRLFLTWM